MGTEPVIAEDPSVVQGGPLDPSSAEGTPPEGMVVGGEPVAPKAPFYKGLTGDIKSEDDMRSYTKSLEEMLVTAQARSHAVAAQQPTAAPLAPIAPSSKERFSELIFSKPEEAYEILARDAEERATAKLAAERNKEIFWNQFYESNSDLKGMKEIVQSIVTARASEVASLKTGPEVADFISKETRKVIETVKRAAGITEVRVPSGSASHLGGSREPVAAGAPRVAQPTNFAEQIRKLKPSGKIRQA